LFRAVAALGLKVAFAAASAAQTTTSMPKHHCFDGVVVIAI
jgi:hypothetical protein